jgi:acyl carrier protein
LKHKSNKPDGPINDDSFEADDNNDMNKVMLQYQQLMKNFLDTQKSIMLSYLQGNHGSPSQSIIQDLDESLDEFNKEDMEMNLHSPQAAESPVLESPVAEEPLKQEGNVPSGNGDRSGETFDIDDVRQVLLRVTGDLTGYPEDMLDPDLDMEADLGIDSIKRVEILNAFTKSFDGSVRQKIQTLVEELSKLKTLSAVSGRAVEIIRS